MSNNQLAKIGKSTWLLILEGFLFARPINIYLPILSFKKMNMLKKALQKNELTLFLSGQGAYFIRNQDWNEHDYTATWFEIMLYSIETNDGSAFRILDEHISTHLQKQQDSEVVYMAVMFICNYFYYKYEDNKLHETWNISVMLKKQLANKLKNELQLPAQKRENLKWCLTQLKDKGFFGDLNS